MPSMAVTTYTCKKLSIFGAGFFFWLAGEFCIFENGIPDGFGIRFVPVSGFAFI